MEHVRRGSDEFQYMSYLFNTILLTKDRSDVLEYSDDKINREIFRTQARHGLGRRGIKILRFC